MEEQGSLLAAPPEAVGFAAASDNNDNNLGVTLSLSAEVASRLRHHQPQEMLQNNKQPPKLTFLSPKKLSSKQTSDEEESVAENEKSDHGKVVGIPLLGPDADPLDNWNEVLPLSSSPATGGVGVDVVEDDDDDDEEENGDKDDTKNVSNGKDDDNDDEWSFSPDPPPHMPVVVVSVKKLVGYIPKQHADKEQLEHQVHAALWYGSAEAANIKQGGNPQEDSEEQVLDAAQHFDERVTELMQSGLATHSTTAEQQQQGGDEQQQQAVVVVPYPEFLCQPRDTYATDDNFAPRTALATATCWKRLLKPHPIPVVATILEHLKNCNRSLVWKYQMHKELVHLARTEKQAQIRRSQSKALREWKFSKREHQLEQLYHVRETLEHRLEMAMSKVHELENVRDQAVAMEIRKRRADNMGLGGLVACDLNSTILAFPDAQSTWLGLAEEEDDYYDDQIGPSFVSDEDDDEDYYGGESDGGGDDDESGGGGDEAEGDAEDEDDASQSEARTTTTAITASPTEHDISNFPRRNNKARRAKVAKKRRRRMEEAAKEAEHQSKLDQARTEEAKVRELCTTTDLKMAQAIRAALEKKMESVDELLESLQEEAWADEEAQENGEQLVPGEEDDEGEDDPSTLDTPSNEFGLLDQVLAMILGSLHPPEITAFENLHEDVEARLREKHTQKIQAEHDMIVKEWKDYFGRLPPSLLGGDPEADEEVTEATKALTKAKAETDRQNELRTAYGIEENDGDDDWDAAADSGDDDDNGDGRGGSGSLSSGQAAPPSIPAPAPAPSPAKQQRAGLRPGGRTRR